MASDGGIFSEGGAPFTGSTGSMVLNKPIVDMATTPDGKGYWLVASDGGIFNYGDANFEGSAGNLPLNKPIVGMAATPDGKGYWLVASDGGIFNYGDAQFYGSAGNLPLNKPIVGMASTPDGKGYWLVASDGGIFNYGDAAFYGSTGGMTLNKPIVGMAATPDGKGYWLVASDGGIFNYGDAAFYGSTGGMTLNKPIVGMASTPDGKGYWLVASDGGIFNYGNAAFYGSTGGTPINKPIVGMALTGISGPASKLVFSSQPGGASGGTAFSTQPVVTVEDAAGDPVTTDNSTVTIGITSGTPTSGGPGVLSTCTSTGENDGVFTFAGCTINTAGTGYKLTATDGQLASATSAPFAVGTGPPTHIAFTTEPDNAIGGGAFVAQPRLTIEDAGGNTVTTDTHGIALAINSGPGGTLSGCSATNTGGVVSFSGCSINTAGTYTLRATDAGDGVTTTSSSFDVGTGVPSQVVFTSEPAGAAGGSAFTTQPTVTIEDAGGNTVTSDTRTIALGLSTGTGTLSGCTSTTTAGVAAFSGCTINTTGTGDVLTAVDSGDALLNRSSPFNVTVGTPAQLMFTTEPSPTASGGTAFTIQPAVTVEDAGGNTVTSDNSTVALTSNGGAGVITGCSQTETDGVVAFSGCSINTDGTYTLTAADGALTTATSDSIVVRTGVAAQLVFNTEPAGATGGTAFTTQPTVTVEDAGGNTVPDTHAITLSLTTGSGALSGCTSTTIAGVAAFSGCTINTAGTGDVLTATDAWFNSLSAPSAAFDVTVGLPAQLAFTTEPAGATGGTAFTTQPTVTIEDAGGNTVTTDTHAITLGLTTGTGTLSGCVSTTTAGVAAFSGCTINTAGTGDILTATDDGDTLTNTSSAFDVTIGTPAQLVFTTEPSLTASGGTAFTTEPAVTVEDAGGNTVTTDSSTVTLTANGGAGAVSGCSQTETDGVVAFSGCSINTDGTYTLTAADGALTTATSDSIVVGTGVPAQLAFTTEPAGATGGTAFTTQPVVTVEDAGGNTVTDDATVPSLTLTTGPGTLSGCSSTTAAGVTTFSGCTIDTANSGDVLTATDTADSLTNTSSAFDVTVGAPAQLVFTIEPGDATAGTAFGTQPTVTIEDAGGNTVTTDDSIHHHADGFWSGHPLGLHVDDHGRGSGLQRVFHRHGRRAHSQCQRCDRRSEQSK